MKKSLFVALFLALCLVFAGPVMAKPGGGVEHEGAGWYMRYKTDGGIQYQYFNHHPDNQSEWTLVTGGSRCDDPGKYTATEHIEFAAIAQDLVSDVSNWGWGNDEASAGGWGGMVGEMDLFANGKYRADVQGGFYGVGDVDAYANAWDNGFESGAFAKAEASGFAVGEGTAYGYRGLDESVSGFLSFEGSLSENTYAAETGYSAGGIDAGQGGVIDWKSVDQMNEFGFCGLVGVADYHDGEAFIKGGSFVSIDPNGSKRSIEGSTFTEAYAPGHAHMAISGGIGGVISNGPAYAAGGASYNVDRTHTNSVAGNAQFVAQVNSYGSYTTVSVSASAHAGSGQPN